MVKWISMKERRPTEEEVKKNFGWFLIWKGGCPRADISRYDGYGEPAYKHGWKHAWDHGITHFAELPGEPEEDI